MQINTNSPLNILNRQRLISGRAYNPSHGFFGNYSDELPTDRTNAEVYGGTYAFLQNGSRLATNVITQNPINNPPTIAGYKYFGQSPNYKVAMDMPYARPVGVFYSPINGAGAGSFGIINNPVFRNDLPLAHAIGILMTGSQLSSGSSLLSSVGNIVNSVGTTLSAIGNIFIPTNAVNSYTDAVTSTIGGSASSLIRLTDPDVLIPFMGALSYAYAGAARSPFSNDTISKGVALAYTVNRSLRR